MAPNLSEKKVISKNNTRKRTVASNVAKLQKMVEKNFRLCGG